MTDLRIPFAKNSDGELVDPSPAFAGVAFSCPGCDGEVRFRRASQRTRAHFFHLKRPDDSLACRESALHLAAKEIIARQSTLALAGLSASHPEYPDWKQAVRIKAPFVISHVRVEHRFPDRRQADLLLQGHDPQDPLLSLLAVEIKVSNPLGSVRSAWYREHAVPCIEVDLHGLDALPSFELLETTVLDVERQRWVYHPGYAAAIQKVVVAVAEYAADCHGFEPGELEVVDEEKDIRRPPLLTWFDKELPAHETTVRQSYWQRYCARLDAHRDALSEALRYFPRKDALQKVALAGMYSPDGGIDELANRAPWFLADKDALEQLASLLSPDGWLDVPAITPADLLWLVRARRDPGNVVPYLIQFGGMCLTNSVPQGEKLSMTQRSAFNKAQMRHEDWLRSLRVGVTAITRILYCRSCRNAVQVTVELSINTPSTARCDCGAVMPFD